MIIAILCYLGCIGAFYSFCESYLGDFRGNKRLWSVLLFGRTILTIIGCEFEDIPYIL